MKRKTIVGRLMYGEIMNENNREPLLCDTIFTLFPDVSEEDHELYEITISNRETKGARRFYFKPVSSYSDCLGWEKSEKAMKGGGRGLYDLFNSAICETLNEKQRKENVVTPRWITFKLIK